MNLYLKKLKRQQRETRRLLKQLIQTWLPEPLLVEHWQKKLETLSREIEIEEGGNDPSN